MNVSVEQSFLIWLGAASNANVAVQHYVLAGHSYHYRLLCNHCQETLALDDVTEAVRSPRIEDFAKTHRHLIPFAVPATEGSGRKFRDE